MDRFFILQDTIHRLYNNLKKQSLYTESTRNLKIQELLAANKELKQIVFEEKSEVYRVSLANRYKSLKELIDNCLEILKAPPTKNSPSEDCVSAEEDILNKTLVEVKDFTDQLDEKTDYKMTTLDLSLALKIVDKFDGNQSRITEFLYSIDFLAKQFKDVPEVDLLSFLKIRLTGPAHGSINQAISIASAKETLKAKFGVKISPQAIQNEMMGLAQRNSSISEFGEEVAKLANKLAAAYVSQGTFEDEAAASDIVQPIAVHAFTAGLKEPQASFFVKARNPTLLNKAISDALECSTTASYLNRDTMTAMWSSHQNYAHSYRGSRGRQRGSYNTTQFTRNYQANNNARGGNHEVRRGANYRGFHSNRGYNSARGNNSYHNNNSRTQDNPRNQMNLANTENLTTDDTDEANMLELFR